MSWAAEGSTGGLEIGFSTLVGPETKAEILALHGIQTNAEWFRPLSTHLGPAGLSMTAVNVPKRGKPWPPAADARDWKVDWVQPLIAQAKVAHRRTGKPVILLGTSWGARVVLRAAQEAGSGAEWCRGVVLVAPALKTDRDLDFAWRAKLVPTAWWAPKTKTFELPLSATDYTNSDCIAEEWLMAQKSDSSAKGNYLVRQATGRHFDQTLALKKEVERGLAQIEVPVLAVFGSNDALVKLASVDALLNKLGGAKETRLLSGGTHAMQIEQPKALARMVGSWIQRTVLMGADKPGTVHLDSRGEAPFQATTVQVTAGKRYRFELSPGQLWQDDILKPCAPETGDFTLHRIGAGLLLRVRHDAADPTLKVRYMQPVVCVGKDETTAVIVQPGRVWTALKSGTLHTFVNDAPWASARTNNHGTITFRLIPVH